MKFIVPVLLSMVLIAFLIISWSISYVNKQIGKTAQTEIDASTTMAMEVLSVINYQMSEHQGWQLYAVWNKYLLPPPKICYSHAIPHCQSGIN